MRCVLEKRNITILCFPPLSVPWMFAPFPTAVDFRLLSPLWTYSKHITTLLKEKKKV